MEEKLLVMRCKQGSRDALQRIYDKYRDRLLVLAIALCHDENIAEDVVHDTFVRFAERIGQFQLTGSLRSYLSVCVVNRVRDLMRRPQRREVCLDGNCPIELQTDEPESRIIFNEQLQQLAEALAELSFEQREVIALRIYGQMRFGAIAKSLSVSVNTIKGRYRYGIDKLQSILNSEVER
jgi:RNA polymerase sigma-70 factor (ECF subfamily)